MTYWTTTRVLDWVGIALLTGGLAYRVGGWRNYWAVLKKPVGTRVQSDRRYWWWAGPAMWLGLALTLLSQWRSWRGL